MKKCTFQLKLFDDESVREKLTVMSKLEACFDDERNTVPEKYYDLLGKLEFNDIVRITIEIL